MYVLLFFRQQSNIELNIQIVLSCLISCFHKFQIGRSLHNIVDLCIDFNIIWALSQENQWDSNKHAQLQRLARKWKFRWYHTFHDGEKKALISDQTAQIYSLFANP